MLPHPVYESLKSLRLHSMARAYAEQQEMPEIEKYTFEDRLGMMLDREIVARGNRRLSIRIKQAGFKHRACMEDIDYRSVRGLDRSLMMSLASCRWVHDNRGVLITGATGAGKTWLSCALGHRACMEGYKVLYRRMPSLLRELDIAREHEEIAMVLHKIIKPDLLILDDWGIEKLASKHSLLMLEIIEERYGNRSTIISSQLPPEKWHETIRDATIADAILDRIVHNSYRIELGGKESMRKLSNLPKGEITETTNKSTVTKERD